MTRCLSVFNQFYGKKILNQEELKYLVLNNKVVNIFKEHENCCCIVKYIFKEKMGTS